MGLTEIPFFGKDKLSALLDLLAKQKASHIDLKVGLTSSRMESVPITPSIGLVSSEGWVSGLKSIEEIKELFLGNRNYQLLTLRVVYGSGGFVDVNFLERKVIQKVRGDGMPLSEAKLLAADLLGGDGILIFTQDYSRAG